MSGTDIYLDIGGNIHSLTATANLYVEAKLIKGNSWDSTKFTSYKPITFVPYPAPSKSVNVEYDHQSIYDIFATAPSGRFRIDEAFGVANTKLNVLLSESTLNDEEFVVDDSVGALRDRCALYVLSNHQLHSSHRMYLVGANKVTWNVPIKPFGFSLYKFQNPNDTNQTRFRSSFLFMQEIRDQNINLDQFASKILNHELGLQRAVLSLASPPSAYPDYRPDDHDSPFCCMNSGFAYPPADSGDNDNSAFNNIPGMRVTFIRNPIFCPADIGRIAGVSW